MEQSRFEYPDVKEVTKTSDNDLLIILSDFHVGASFNNQFGFYDTDVAKERLQKLYYKVI